MKKRKEVGSILKTMPENDAIDVQWLDNSLESVQKAIAYAMAHPNHLPVPDAGNEREFLKKAKQVYRETHISNLKRGPRLKESFAINTLADLSLKLGSLPTQGKMIKALIDRVSLGENTLSKNTAGKYARLYRLSREDMTRLSQADQRWLCKNFGNESLSMEWWLKRMLGPWMEERLKTSGLGEEILKIFAGAYTPAELQRERDKMEMIRSELHEKYSSQRQKAMEPRPKISRRNSG